MVYFNSRPSARGDLSSAVDKSRRNHFNSRPSARGDGQAARRCGTYTHFNSRPSARGDYKTQIIESSNGKFQFTPLREGRPKGGEYYGQRRTFQFTPLREGRPLAKFRILCYTISIHAPPRGATATGSVCVETNGISIHAPPRGATHVSPAAFDAARFQFTPLREGRPRANVCVRCRKYFNSRPSARGDTRPRSKCR